MTQITHLVRFAAARSRLLLAIWVLAVLVSTLVEGMRPAFASRPQIAAALAVTASLLWLTDVLLRFVLVSYVIHSDPAVGTDAFWMTRPIAPGALLGSKLLLLFVVAVLLPALARSVLMTGYEVSLSRNIGVTLRGVEMQTIVMTLLTLAAALTPSLARFALLCGGTLFAIAAAFAAFAAIQMARFDDGTFSGTASFAAPDPTAAPIFNLLFVIATITAIAWLYRTRARTRALLVLAVGIALAIGLSTVWPWPLLAHQLEVPAWARDAATLRIVVDPATIGTDDSQTTFARGGERLAAVRGAMTLFGVEPGWTAHVYLRQARVVLESVTVESVTGIMSSTLSLLGPDAPLSSVVAQTIGVKTVEEAQAPQIDRQTLFAAPQADVARHAPASGYYQGSFYVTLAHHEIEGTLPLQPGAKHVGPAYRLVVDSVSRVNGNLVATLRESRASSVYDRRPLAFYTLYLRNRGRQEALAGSEDYDLSGQFSLLHLLPFAVGSVGFGVDYMEGFSCRGLRVWFPSRYRANPTTPAIDDGWLAGADLVVVRQTQEGTVERTLEIPDFPLRNVINKGSSVR
jgi:hypothetical protein